MANEAEATLVSVLSVQEMNRFDEMPKMLQEAAIQGNVAFLIQLLEEDKLLLDRYATGCFPETPLHMPAMLGHLDFTQQVLTRKPDFAKEFDSHGSSPLHLAAANGHVEVVKTLLLANADMCLALDRKGRSPLHVAVIKGRVEVLKELVQSKPEALQVCGDRGETLLQLCVEHRQFGALKLLIMIINDRELVNSKVNDGQTVLHIAVADREIQIVRFLIAKTAIEVNALNSYGFTALDILLAQGLRNVKDMYIKDFLLEFGALSSKDVCLTSQEIAARNHHNFPCLRYPAKNLKKQLRRNPNWLEAKRNALMVVASLIATMAFQAGISPPNGVWQDNSQISQPGSDRAGCSIMATRFPRSYAYFVAHNTTSFLASLAVILLLISGLPLKRKFAMWSLMIIMWIAITSTVTTYAISIYRLTCNDDRSHRLKVAMSVVLWGLMSFLLLGHYLRVRGKVAKFFRKLIMR